MGIRVRKFIDLVEVNLFLRGGIQAGTDLRGAVYGLYNKTLVFSSPSAATVTFTTTNSSTQDPLTIVDIISQINAQTSSNLAKVATDGTLVLETDNASSAVTISGTGTANVALGFDASGESGTVYAAPSGTAPYLISVNPLSLSGGGYIVVTEESE